MIQLLFKIIMLDIIETKILAFQQEFFFLIKAKVPMVAQVGYYIMHEVDQQRDYSLLLITVEDHI